MRTWLVLAAAFAFAVAAAAGTASGSRTVASTCPVPDSGTCLGKLAQGTYTSGSFRPKVTYRVTAGWANYLDIPGLYLLQPPGSKPPGNTIAGSFIGLETRVGPEASDCRSRLAGVGTSPSAIASWIAKDKGLVVTGRRPTTLGGLHGIVLDVRMAKGAKGCLSAGATVPAVPLLVGMGPSSFDHEVAPGFSERHYLLAYRGGTLDIQVDDASGGRHLAGYTAVVRTFRFS